MGCVWWVGPSYSVTCHTHSANQVESSSVFSGPGMIDVWLALLLLSFLLSSHEIPPSARNPSTTRHPTSNNPMFLQYFQIHYSLASNCPSYLTRIYKMRPAVVLIIRPFINLYFSYFSESTVNSKNKLMNNIRYSDAKVSFGVSISCWYLLYLEPGWMSGIALDYKLDDQGFETQQGLGNFLFTIASRSALDPTQPPTQWVPWLFPSGQSGRCVELNTFLWGCSRNKQADSSLVLLISPTTKQMSP
jgi:hypothetical protein